ncbi:MAG TPA: pseudouridine synthase [Dongiaceae bacterium]|nr:pseudouridine synthase [Dongiaceae bacterium]
MLPCLVHEDEHLLVVNKPAGLNTHAPGLYAGEGLYDWLRGREPRWAALAIIHRLDKETSGLIVFSKSPLANRSLTAQFTRHAVRKKYLLLTDRPVPDREVVARSALVRAGERYVSRPAAEGAPVAETRFRFLAEARGGLGLGRGGPGIIHAVEAEPLTGRTHQIRVHAAERGFPILGDTLYGGTPAPRVCLHAAELAFEHPATGRSVVFRAPSAFEDGDNARFNLRAGLIDPEATDAYRIVHGAADERPGWYVERFGDYLLSQSQEAPTAPQRAELARLLKMLSARGACHKILKRQVRRAAPDLGSPEAVLGESPPGRFLIRENGLRFEIGFGEGRSVGLFLDQRDNRRRLLSGHIAAGFDLASSSISEPCPGEVLNVFAYTCGFSVCAAKAGARATSIDLSKRYLDWGRRNFALNELDAGGHDFLYGEAFDWLRRLGRKPRRFAVILLDPPTFSQSKESGVFRAQTDYGRLISAALPLLRGGGVLFASTNAADWPPEQFLAAVGRPIEAARRPILQRHYAPQPPDFPISRAEPAYLKTVWLRIG